MREDSLWTMRATLNRAVRNQAMRAHSAKLLATIARETGRNVQAERLMMRHTAADCITLRGVPAIGPGVTGAIRYTRPEDCLR